MSVTISNVAMKKGWTNCRVKHLARYINGYGFAPDDWSDKGLPILRIQNLSNPDAPANRYQGTLHPNYLIKSNDILISWSGSLGVFRWMGEDAWLNQHIFKVIPNDQIVDCDFFVWLAGFFLGEMSQDAHGSTMQHVTKGAFGGFPVQIPIVAEQRRIASYLDEQTAKIDQLMDMRRRQMALLKEQRAALIQEAVTRGLNPNVPMKDSGLPWLGEIPAHWGLTRAKFVSKIFVPQRNKPDLNEDEGYYWVTMEEMSNPIIDSAAYRVSDADLTNAGSRILPSGAIIASCVGNFGAASINAVPVVINQQLQAFIPHRINNEFLRLLITISASYFEMIATAATLVYVNQDGFANLPVPLPPVDEQVDIIDFIASESTRFDTIHASYTRQLTLLTEYRAALIHECVTGRLTKWVKA